MSLKDTYKYLRDLLNNIVMDLDKSENGNKAASQRVRTGTVRLEKVAKLFRKESISSEKKNKGQKKPTRASSARAKSASKGRSTASKGKAQSSTRAKSASVRAKPRAKAVHARTSLRPRQLTVKKATAKLPTRHSRAQ